MKILTAEQAERLSFYLKLTQREREEQIEVWSNMERDKNEDGTPLFKNAKLNKEWFIANNIFINNLIKYLDAPD